VNGKGMISVDVNAPKETRVTAEGEGLVQENRDQPADADGAGGAGAGRIITMKIAVISCQLIFLRV
jgi:hypothetical protein